MASGANLPSVEQVLDIADDFGFELTAQEAETYCNLVRGAVKSCRRLDEMTEYRPPVRYPRTVGFRPEAKDNPVQRLVLALRDRGRAGGSARRQDGRRQGRDLRRGRADDERQPGARGLHAGCRCDRRDPPSRRRGHHSRQDERRGLLVLGREPHVRARAGAQRPQADPRRPERLRTEARSCS